jgi:predicted Ser/Thr protein kinase
METKLEKMIKDCEKSLWEHKFQFTEEWLEDFIEAAKECVGDYYAAEEEIEKIRSKLKSAKTDVDCVQSVLDGLGSTLDSI